MTINKLITLSDEVKPNILSDELKFGWISTLDSMINRDVFRKDDVIEYKIGEEGDRELLVYPPYDDMYQYYMFAMIDYANNETSDYSNDMMMFNSRYDSFAKDYIRRNLPDNQGGFVNLI